MRIKDLCVESHDRARRKGFYENPPSDLERLCLIHEEVSEATQATRSGEPPIHCRESDGKPEGPLTELADVVIRICDFVESKGWDLEHAIRLKSDYNETRPHKHGKLL